MDKNDNEIILNITNYIKDKIKNNNKIWKKVGANLGVIHYALNDSVLEDIKENLNNNVLTVVNSIYMYSEESDLRIYLSKGKGYRILLEKI